MLSLLSCLPCEPIDLLVTFHWSAQGIPEQRKGNVNSGCPHRFVAESTSAASKLTNTSQFDRLKSLEHEIVYAQWYLLLQTRTILTCLIFNKSMSTHFRNSRNSSLIDHSIRVSQQYRKAHELRGMQKVGRICTRCEKAVPGNAQIDQSLVVDVQNLAFIKQDWNVQWNRRRSFAAQAQGAKRCQPTTQHKLSPLYIVSFFLSLLISK